MKKTGLLFFLTLGTVYSGYMAGAEVKKNSKVKALSPADKAAGQFLGCRKKILKLFKAGLVDKHEFQEKSDYCKHKYPAAELYVICKKQALKKHAKDPAALKEALEECKDTLEQASFDPDQTMPFFFYRKRLFFAGLPMDKGVEKDSLKFINYDCNSVKTAVATPQKADFMFFGNHPQVFEALKEKTPDVLRKQWKLPAGKNAKGTYVANFGKVYGDIATPQASVYFPTGSCGYAKNTGDIIKGLKAHFLIEGTLAIPYLAVAFYNSLPKDETGQTLTDELLERLSAMDKKKKYVVTKSPKKAQLFVSSFKITSFDSEGDPQNICKDVMAQALLNAYLAVVQWDSKKGPVPEYILLANISLMCDYGNRVANNF